MLPPGSLYGTFISNIGSGTGLPAGQTPLTGHTTCDLWSALSRLRPSQQLGACIRTISDDPAGHDGGMALPR